MSLGVDPISSNEKICNYDCTYCQLGDTLNFETERKEFISVKAIVEEIKTLPDVRIDYITFSGSGEPTLAKNLGEMIRLVKDARLEKVAVITNSSLINRRDVQEDLLKSDFVLAKLDADCSETFSDINRPVNIINFDAVVKGLVDFKKRFSGKFALQIMFVEENLENAQKIAEIARSISPDEVQINTPLRPCSRKPLTKFQMNDIKRCFDHLHIVSVYESETKQYHPFDENKTVCRHGNFRNTSKN